MTSSYGMKHDSYVCTITIHQCYKTVKNTNTFPDDFFILPSCYKLQFATKDVTFKVIFFCLSVILIQN